MQYIVNDEDVFVGERIDKFLSEQNEEFTRSYIQKLIEEENVLVNGNIVKASYKIKAGDNITVNADDVDELEIVAENIPLDIVYEDKDIIVINKEKGMVVHPGNGNYTGTLVNSLMYTHKDKLSAINGTVRPGIVHRIDKDTSGVIVVAKTDKAHKILSDAFKVHNITRKYIAIVKGIVDKDNLKIDLPIGRSSVDRIKMAVTEKNSRNAVTYIKVLERLLEPYHFKITSVPSGKEVIYRIKKGEEFDLIFMDHMMPGFNGIEVVQILKKLEYYDIPPIVAVTANAVTGMREMYLKEGFDDYLAKPINDLYELLMAQKSWPAALTSTPALRLCS